ncbi:Ig-like domain-containing protein [Piscinibacter sp. XHJ-5]|uniref:Ig-like domain-containing protein n=1 Tax=Piscinibacter sp. XHJ-5 TaxID=3037797 RepID=UPI002452F761|nr:Ig-like domain-containing protein [Piscinibacter sp. XHJ-5]
MPARIRAALSWAALLTAAACVLHGCGGSIHFGFGDDFDDGPPSVNLTTAAVSVQAGQTARFVAAASDEDGVDRVSFYRVDGNASVLLGSDTSAPYEWNAVAPADGRSSLQVFARAVDGFGSEADSATVSVAITP